MKLKLKAAKRFGMAGLLLGAATCAFAQTSNTIVANFGVSPASSQAFSINLVNTGTVGTIAGFAFKLKYDPSQVEVTGLSDNTGQAKAKVQYTFGKEIALEDGSAERSITATTLSNLENATNLVQINLKKKADFAPPFKFQVEDRLSQPTVDGLQGADLENIPHSFDSSAINQ